MNNQNPPKGTPPKATPPAPKVVPTKPERDNRGNQMNPNHQPTKGNDNPLRKD